MMGMPERDLRWFFAIFFFVVFPIGGASAQDVLGAPRLRLTGPNGQLVFVVARYFDGSQLVKTTSSRIEIDSDAEPTPLDFGYSGIHLTVTIPTRRATTIQLLDGVNVVASQTTNSIGQVELSHGATATEANWRQPRVLLDEQERQLVARFLAALRSGESHSLVSTLPMANIDWQTLDAYCQATKENLGEISAEANDLDGWLSWEGSLGARVIAGVVKFERGECQFTLMVIDNLLVDVLVKSRAMPEEWFHGPSTDEVYVERSLRLAGLLFQGDAAKARELFSRRYYEQITLESLQQLAELLRERYGTDVTAAEHVGSELSGYDSETRSRSLHVYHALTLDSKKRCICDVEFVFPCGPDVISRGHLASINLREAWQSAAPQLVELTLAVLNDVVSENDAGKFYQWLHPELLAQFDRRRFEERLEKLPDAFGSLLLKPDWDQWRANQVGEFVTAEGQVQLEKCIAIAQVHFAEGKLLGLTLLGKDRAFFTMDLVAQPEVVSRIGLEFWRNLLAGQIEAAHQNLAPDFQTQFPFEKFSELVAASGIAELRSFREIQPAAVRFVKRLDRSLPVMTVAYFIAVLDNDVRQPLRCEFRHVEVAQGVTYELLNFNTEFDAVFPVLDDRPAGRLARAFQSHENSGLMNLLSAKDRSEVDHNVLAGFLRKLHATIGEPKTAVYSRLMHEYSPGRRIELLNSSLETEAGSVPLSAVFQYDELKSFSLVVPEMAFILDTIENDDVFRQASGRFISDWISGNLESALARLVDELKTAAVSERLQRLRTRLAQEQGVFRGMKCLDLHRSEDSNNVRLEWELEFEHGTSILEVDLLVDAFAARVSGIDIK